MEYLARFDFDIQYIKGTLNKVADALSRYYESDTWYDIHPETAYVDADVRLDPERIDLPWNRLNELKTGAIQMKALQVVDNIRRRRSNCLLERQEDGDTQAAALALVPIPEPAQTEVINEVDENPTVMQSRQRGEDLTAQMNRDDSFLNAIRHGYSKDPVFTKVLAHPDDHKSFRVIDGLIWVKNLGGERVLAVPKAKIGEESIFG
jgi:hypothetical protein